MTKAETVAGLGEFGLIARLRAVVGQGGAVIGIGDDAAVLEGTGDLRLLATVDMLVEDVHFRRTFGPAVIGRHAMAVNLSDLAAMGGSPRAALVSLALPPLLEVSFVEELYRAMNGEVARFGAGVVGGNIARTEGPLIIDVTMLGEAPADQVVLRRGARPGDLLCVTGQLGEAAARLQRRERDIRAGDVRIPQPRIEAGRALAANHLVHAMIDVSDGLAADLHHLAAASGVGAVIAVDALPVAIRAREVAAALRENPLDLALYGGEDYELLMALPPEHLEEARQAVGQLNLAVIGWVLHADDGILLEGAGGARTSLPARGWQHF